MKNKVYRDKGGSRRGGKQLGWVAYEILVSAQGPLIFGLGQKGLGLRCLGPGLGEQ